MYQRQSVLYVERAILGPIVQANDGPRLAFARELEFRGEDGGTFCVTLHAHDRAALVFERDPLQEALTPDTIPSEREVLV
jgi:hypothetical protein